MSADFEFDPERALWKPNRRGFLSLFACAVASAFLPDVPVTDTYESVWMDVYSHVGTPGMTPLFAKYLAEDLSRELKWANTISREYSKEFSTTERPIMVKIPGMKWANV